MQTDHGEVMTDGELTELELGSAISAGAVREIKRLRADVERLRSVAKAYEAWEADIVLDGDWTRATPFLTSGQFDRMLELQQMRNEALALTEV